MPTLMKASLDTFKLPSENISDFRAQWGKLTEKDKEDLKSYFEAEGVKIEAPAPK